MKLLNLAMIVGSLRKESINLKLAKAIAKLAQDKFQVQFLQIGDLPLFNQDLEADFPAAATRLKTEIAASDGVLIVTPEYNRSMPGVLKNAIDWASRPYGTNAFAGKPLGLLGASGGAIGTACSQHSLRPVLAYLDTIMMGQPEVYFQFKENLDDPKAQKLLQDYISKLAGWIERYKA